MTSKSKRLNNTSSYFFKMIFSFEEKGVQYDVSHKNIIKEPLGENIYGKDTLDDPANALINASKDAP